MYPDGNYVIYFPPHARDYVGCFGQDERAWWRWPATAHGWLERTRMKEPSEAILSTYYEPTAFHQRLAVQLSGVEL